MKKILFASLFILIFTQQSFADSSFKTFTPFPPPSHQNCPYHNYKYNNYNYPRYNYHPNNNYYYNTNPYYYNGYYPKRTVVTNIKDFFGGGQITGITPSFNYNNPYGYQSGTYDANGNYNQNDYDFKSGASVKILD